MAKKISCAEAGHLLHDIHSFGVDLSSRTIFLNGHVCETADIDPGIDYRSAAAFLKNLIFLDRLSDSRITVHMQITGGQWEQGMAMFDAIKAARSEVVILSYAQASSMSGILLQAANYRIMMPHTHFMLHYGSIGFEGTSQAASEAAKFNDNESKRMLMIFAQRALQGNFFKKKGWGIKKVSSYIHREMSERGDWYLTADEAVNMGFADAVYGSPQCEISLHQE